MILVTPQQHEQYRAIGSRLAFVLRQRQGQLPSPAAMQGIAADLVGARTELLLPVKELMSRPGFQKLIAKSGSRSGALEGRALLADLEMTFTPAVINALEEVLGGFLDLPTAADSVKTQGSEEPDPLPSVQSSATARQTNPNARPSPQPQTPQMAEVRASKHPPTRGINPVALTLGVCIATATTVVAGTVMMRSPLLCTSLGLCSSGGVSPAVQQTLDAARRAVADLQSATSLVSYRSAAMDLERELQRLRSETLTPDQQQKLEELVGISRKAQASLLQEAADQEQLQRATAALVAARQLTGAEQMVQLTTAEQALQAIRAGGFAAADATRLRADVAALQAEQQQTPDAPVAEAQPHQQPAAGAPSVPRTSAPSGSHEAQPVTREPKDTSGGEWRSEPLF